MPRTSKSVPQKKKATRYVEQIETQNETLSEDDAATVRSANSQIAQAQQQLGNLRFQYAKQEQALLATIQQSQQKFESVVLAIAEKHGINMSGGNVVLDLSTMTFIPRK